MGFKKFISGVTDSVGLTDTGATDRALASLSEAMGKSNALQEKMYGENKERFDPYSKAGLQSFQDMITFGRNAKSFGEEEGPFQGHSGVFGMNDFQKDPGYDFRMQEGQKALERSAAARGTGMSGGALKALARYGQDYGSGEYDKAYNRFNMDYSNSRNRFNEDQGRQYNYLSNIAQYGQNANNAIAGIGSNYAGNVGNNFMSFGNAAAGAELNRGNDMKDLWKMGAQAAMMACWVARAVFGEKNPKWMQARSYILNIGPKWFKELYLEYGEKFAKIVEKNPVLKKVITPLFEYFAWRGRSINFSVKFLGGSHV